VENKEKVHDIQAWLELSPQKMLIHLPQKISASMGSAFTATRLRTYKLRVVHEFKQPDYAAKIHVCN
jgi:hypothetical protein